MGIDKVGRNSVLPTFHLLPGSSVAEQVTVNHLVVGSTPTRAAISAPETYKSFWGFFVGKNKLGVRFVTGFFTCPFAVPVREPQAPVLPQAPAIGEFTPRVLTLAFASTITLGATPATPKSAPTTTTDAYVVESKVAASPQARRAREE